MRRPLWTVLAAVLVAGVLVVPAELTGAGPADFVRIPIEGLVALALLMVLPSRPRRILAAVLGAGLGVLTVLKLLDMGFFSAFDRSFNVVGDWTLLDDAYGFVRESIGGTGALAALAGLVLVVLGLLVFTTFATLRVADVAVRHDRVVTRGVAALAVLWVVFAGFGSPVSEPATAALAYGHAAQVHSGIQDRRSFPDQIATDRFRDVPGDRLLTALRGKDVVFTFVESYGRNAVEDPGLAPAVGQTLADGDRRLRADGFSSQSGWLTSPAMGGGSWLAHATLLSGVWASTEQRHTDLLKTDRLTVNKAFDRAGWDTVGVMPAVTRDWPEGKFFGYERFYDTRNLGYRGPDLSYAPMPDQFTLAKFQEFEYGRTDRGPLFAEIPLVSSHGPWSVIPRMVPWEAIGDGSVYADNIDGNGVPEGAAKARVEYRKSIQYTLESLISWVETYGDDDLVLVFLGDHQPSPIITGKGASRDVPITVVTRDRAVLDRISGWGWQDGLKPGPQSPVWRMDTFRDRFLTAFA